MTLGDLIKEYREQHNISMDEFSKVSNLSKGYISMLENNTNPRSNKPIAPTLPTIKKISMAMNADVDSVLKLLDSDQEISLDAKSEETRFCNNKEALDAVEIHIKDIIIKRYGSLKKFCDKIGMPWTTLDSILKRGFANSNITNVMKISHELKVDTESLASGKIVYCVEKLEIESGEPPKIMQYYTKLNDIGKHEATKRVMELTEVPRYLKEDTNYVNAAHADNYMDAPEELRQLEEDMMDDENF